MTASSNRRPVPAVKSSRLLRAASRVLVEDLERRALLTITVNVTAGGTLDINPMSSIFPAGGYDYMAVLATGVPGTTNGKMFKINGASTTAWGTTTGGTVFAPDASTTKPRIYAGEGFRYVSNAGTAVGTTESIPVKFSTAAGFQQVNDTLVINVVAPAGAPQITQQPVTQQSIAKNNRATLSVAATGSGTLTYQWYQGVAPNGFAPIAGATGSTYTTPVLTTAGQFPYWVKVTNSVASVASLTATVFVGSYAVVSSGGPYTVGEKGGITLAGNATDPDNGLYLVYNWDFDGDGYFGEQTTAFGDERGKNAVFTNNYQLDGPGTKTISLKVTNDKALNTIVPATINVTNTAPASMFTSDGTAGTVKFYNTVDTPADLASMKYSYDFNNDGTFDVVDTASTSVNVPSTYLAAYLAGQPVRGRAKDSSGATSPDYLATVNGHVITVTTSADTTSANASYAVGTAGVSLRDAITLAESDPDADQILFDPAAFTGSNLDIKLTLPASAGVTNSAFVISTPVAVTGPGGSRGLYLGGKDVTTNYRAFTVASTGSLILENLNVHHFASTGASAAGGAIYASGPLTVRRSTFSTNAAAGTAGLGGAIAVDKTTAVIDNSTFTLNTAGLGGAIAGLDGSALSLRHDTISNNTAAVGAGLYVRGTGAGTTASLYNTIVSGNVGGTDYHQYSVANLVLSSGFNNLIGTPGAPGAAYEGRYITADPGLGGLANNGGPTQTMSIKPTSPAYNAGVPVAAITTDQRGSARPVGLADIGAFEVQLAVATSPTAQSVFPGTTATFTAAAVGTPAATVQWQVSTDNGATFANVSGATSTALTFTTALTQNGNLYRAVFTNAAGTVATAAAPLAVSGTVTLEGGAFTVLRSGTLNLVTVTGPAGSASYPLGLLSGFVVRNANVTFNSDLGLTNAAPGTIALSVAADAAVTFTTSQHLAAVTLNGGATLAAGGDTVLRVSGLTLGAAGRLDLNDNALIHDYASAAGPMAGVRSMIAAGRAGGAWTGSGLTSTAALNRSGKNTTLGVMDAGAYKAIYGATALFAGESVGNAVLVKYTLYGDADFNGTANFADFVRLQSGFGQANATTAGGDFDGDGDADFADFVLLQSNFGQTL